MKKYMKNKNFIPEKFYYKMELKEQKNERRVIILFLLINLSLFSTTFKYIRKSYHKQPITHSTTEQNNINYNNVNTWIRNVFKDDIEEAYINNNNGEIIVESVDKINYLNLDNSININDVSLDNDNRYKLGVGLNE
ncbi:hypothetical protein [Clostridium sp. BL-8]|uniref:hypothetical protein n=1 Tax=Clostridium sp. BL-8 TaxID=349938 RepID=UPI00098BF8E1|nr:hypothetical protein [Clostridium sp. BL-8]OOM80026.1 hypothetical protein CLOBL_10740 [Clostridium sp. BL-8]